MIKIKRLSDIQGILLFKKANPEIVRLVQGYFLEKDRVYYKIVKFFWYEIDTDYKAKLHFGISLKEYREIKYRIIVDITDLIQDYYIAREKRFKTYKNVIDLVTYKST